jgi:hypothetical protein
MKPLLTIDWGTSSLRGALAPMVSVSARRSTNPAYQLLRSLKTL